MADNDDGWEARMAARAAERKAAEPVDPAEDWSQPTAEDHAAIAQLRAQGVRMTDLGEFACACVGAMPGCHWCPCRHWSEACGVGWG